MTLTHKALAAVTVALALTVSVPTTALATETASDQTRISASAKDPGRPEAFTAVPVIDFAEAILFDEAYVVDVRTAEEFHDGRIARSTNFDMHSETFVDNFEHLPKDIELALYCQNGQRSAEAMDMLRHMGFTNVYHLAGGFQAWVDAGKPVEESDPEDKAGKLAAKKLVAAAQKLS